MASIQENIKEGKTVSYKFKVCLGRDKDGKQIFKCKTWYPPENLTHPQPDKLSTTLATVMGKVLTDLPIEPQEGILHHSEGVDLLPANIELSGIDISLVNALSRETVLQANPDNGNTTHENL